MRIRSFAARGLGVARLLLPLLVLASPPGAQAYGSQSQTHVGDELRYAIPVATFGFEWLRGEREGAWQYAEETGASLVAMEVLKRTTHERRPDGSDTESFPSGHAVAAYSAASYVTFRYGLEPAVPLYVLGTYVGWTRVQARKHRWGDVAGALGVTTVASWWLVRPRAGSSVAVVPAFGRHRVALGLAASF